MRVITALLPRKRLALTRPMWPVSWQGPPPAAYIYNRSECAELALMGGMRGMGLQ